MSGNSGAKPNASFTDFVRRITSVPHSEIKAKLDAEKEAKQISKSASPVSVVSSKRAT
jgi:hypothetical protein